VSKSVEEQLYQLASIELERLRRHIFGQKAEHVDPGQMQLAFDTIVQMLAGAGAQPGAQPDAGATSSPEGDGAAPSGSSEGGGKGRPTRPHGRQRLPEHLPVERIELLPPEARDERAPALVRIGEEVSETLEWRPASFVRLQIVRPKFAVKGAPEQGITIADVPDSPIPRCLAGPGLLAHVLVSKYADHLPLHRLEKMFERWGLHLSRSTLCGWVAPCAEKLELIVSAMANDALSAHCIAIDATGVLVQAKEKCRQGHFWVLVADRDHVLFRFTSHHNQAGPKEFLRGYKGYVQADASNVYERLFRTEQVTEVGCWAHCRRHFFEAMTSDRERATTAIGFIQKLYAIDKTTKELPPSRRTEQRRKAAEPVLEAFRRWLQAQDLLVLPKSPIAGAIGYALNQWTALTRFLEDGRLRLDNNRSELELRREAVGRKNWLFVGSNDGAHWNATIVSLIASCALHSIEPWAYLRDVLILLPTWPLERVIELAPKSWKQTLENADARQRLAASPWPRAPAATPS
jgi:transposase